MKIIRKGFSPITIVLETKEEAEALITVTGHIRGTGKFIRHQMDKIYNALSEFGIACRFDLVEKSMKLRD